MLNLASLLEHSAQKYASKTAFTFMDTSLSFAQINGAANQVANGLADLGIQQGDKVALSCFNLPYFPIIYNGILKAGAVVVRSRDRDAALVVQDPGRFGGRRQGCEAHECGGCQDFDKCSCFHRSA